MTHTDDSYGFRLAPGDGGADVPGLVYSGDCGRAEDLDALVRPGDTLLCEVSFGPGPVVPGRGIWTVRLSVTSRAARGPAASCSRTSRWATTGGRPSTACAPASMAVPSTESTPASRPRSAASGPVAKGLP